MEWERENAGAHPPSIAFPSFDTTASGGLLPQLRYATWAGVMVPIKVGAANVSEAICGLTSSGPVALYDGNHSTIAISPLDNFKSAVHTASSSAWETGVSSEIRSLPPGFSHRTLLRFGRGVTATVKEWGETVLRLKGTDRAQTQTDLATNYLSYWTDNGQTALFENLVTFEKAAVILLAGCCLQGRITTATSGKKRAAAARHATRAACSRSLTTSTASTCSPQSGSGVSLAVESSRVCVLGACSLGKH